MNKEQRERMVNLLIGPADMNTAKYHRGPKGELIFDPPWWKTMWRKIFK